jgi:hypothetical protein
MNNAAKLVFMAVSHWFPDLANVAFHSPNTISVIIQSLKSVIQTNTSGKDSAVLD